MVLGTGSHKGLHGIAPLEYEGKHQNEQGSIRPAVSIGPLWRHLLPTFDAAVSRSTLGLFLLEVSFKSVKAAPAKSRTMGQ
jgi:hypothetical protein